MTASTFLLCLPLLVQAQAKESPCGAASPSPTGETCGGANSPASLGNTSNTQQGAGNPINVITGNKYQHEVDMPALPGVLGLEIVRHYNSAASGIGQQVGLLGRGWKLSYETELKVGGGLLRVIQADGTVLVFGRDLASRDGYVASNPSYGRITVARRNGARQYTWAWANGRQLSFSDHGKLEQILAPTGEYVSLQYDTRGWLVAVTDPQGRQLRLHYLDRKAATAGAVAGQPQFAGVQNIDSPVGRFVYEYGNQLPSGSKAPAQEVLANLVKVRLPTHYDSSQRVHAWTDRGVSSSSISKLYHYEDARFPTLLTGISVQGQGSDRQQLLQRLSTWAYDEQGRARLSVKGEPARYETGQDGRPVEPKRLVPGSGIEEVTLAWSKAGQTLLTNSLGQQTVYKTAVIAGENRILEVRGPGCASCGPANMRYGYDALGRMIEETMLSPTGEPLRTVKTERDGRGRVLTVSTIAYRKGHAQAPRWTLRYQYGPDTASELPVLIARPSVVPGKEHQVRITYNRKGQIKQLTETGYSQLDEKERPLNLHDKADAERAVSIARTTTYTYANINGRSVLASIDGPLVNGPKNHPEDSDITLVNWDASGNRITGWTEPGGFHSAIAYNEISGQLSQVSNDEGKITTFTYDARSQLVHVASNAPGWLKPRSQSYQYDALGRLTEAGAGSESDRTYIPGIRQAFDVPGNLLWQASANGILEQRRYDTESRLLETGRYSNTMRQTERYAYDRFGRIIEASTNQGTTAHIGYDDEGVNAITDGIGRSRRLEPGSARNPGVTTASVRQLRDDFGRDVASVSPDSGTTVRRFDEADRLVASTDAEGNRAEYVHDAAGRITRQVIIDNSEKKPLVTLWRYQGKQLVTLEHPTQSEHYRYDQRGLLVTKTVSLKRDDNSELTSITRYRYDDEGRLSEISQPDGSTLQYRRNGQGQVVSLSRSRIHTPWLQWLLPPKTIAEDIQRDIVGVKSYTAGNGIGAYFQRSQDGVLARVVYRNTRITGDAAASVHSDIKLVNLFGIGVARAAQARLGGASGEDAGRTASLLPGALALPTDPQAILDYRYLWDAQGNLLYAQDQVGMSTGSYAYDSRDRLIVSVAGAPGSTHLGRYFYDGNGNRVLSQQGFFAQENLTAGTQKAVYQEGTHRWRGDESGQVDYDGNGQPERIGKRDYAWDALGRLVQVSEDKTVLARYRYNHRGERIGKEAGGKSSGYLYEGGMLAAELDGQGKVVRTYFYLSDQPLALVDIPAGRALNTENSSLLRQILHDIVTAVSAWTGEDEHLVWMHTNHLGAVEVATGDKGQPVWRARYGAFGEILKVTTADKQIEAKGLVINLRLPGQYEDNETGLYYNKRRYYDPRAGRYLTPDPLGAPDGPNPYAYVRGNPLKYIDPSGLVLFAFDGTGNTKDETWLKENDSSFSNVWRFYGLYQDGDKHYVSGVGTPWSDGIYRDINPSDYVPWYIPLSAQTADLGGNYSGPARIERMIQYFNAEAELFADDTLSMDMDLVGFSRGAAEARDFANRIVANTKNGWYSYKVKSADGMEKTKCQKLNFRFMGLYDTVLSTNLSSYTYNLAIPDAFAYVAQAVALNEYRGSLFHPYLSTGAFPGESIMLSKQGAAAQEGKTRIEMGFIGAHADIGGGFGKDDSQLAQVALAWMVKQAMEAGVVMDDSDVLHTIIADPVIHDKSGSILTGAPAPNAEDRLVQYRNGTRTRQRDMPFSSGMTWADTQQYIEYLSENDPRRPSFMTGTVNMQGYLDWLSKNGYGIDMRVN